MIYRFRIISDENKEFARELLIGGEHTFLDFHHCLQENLNYDPKQLASFFITNAAWEKKLQITLMDMMDDESDNVLIMENETIGDHISEEGQRLLYVFDFFSERSFFMELTDILDAKEVNPLPRIVFSHGDPPEQIDLGLEPLGIDDENFDDDFSSESFDEDFPEDMDYFDTDDFPDN